MIDYPQIRLAAGREGAVRRFHPWIFSGAIESASQQLEAGDTVKVLDHAGNILGVGFCESGSIAVKMLSFVDCDIDNTFWDSRLRAALEARVAMGIVGNPQTDCYRLVHSEGDGLPGLIVDIYGSVAVVQAQTEGMALHISEIADALLRCGIPGLKAVYNKSAEAMKRMGKEAIEDGYLFGSADDAPEYVVENGIKYAVDWVKGQKTGFFLDQRFNRALVGKYAQGRRVLNTFCYTGGFSVAALQGGAQQVVSVDCSAKAIDTCAYNIRLNGYSADEVNPCITEDAKLYLQNMAHGSFDLIVLDPPAFAKNRKSLDKALAGYRYINAEALKKIASGGILFTFSCSQAVSCEQFSQMVNAAAILAKRKVRILHRLSQPEDHPVSIFHPEGEYLKGLVLFVE